MRNSSYEPDDHISYARSLLLTEGLLACLLACLLVIVWLCLVCTDVIVLCLLCDDVIAAGVSSNQSAVCKVISATTAAAAALD